MHDIRSSIPFTDQTNPSKFPQYEFRPYPRMMSDANGKPYLKADKSAVVVQDAAEEAMFHADPSRFGVVKAKVTQVSSLSNESDELAKLREELAVLKASSTEEPKRRGRPPKVEAA